MQIRRWPPGSSGFPKLNTEWWLWLSIEFSPHVTKKVVSRVSSLIKFREGIIAEGWSFRAPFGCSPEKLIELAGKINKVSKAVAARVVLELESSPKVGAGWEGFDIELLPYPKRKWLKEH